MDYYLKFNDEAVMLEAFGTVTTETNLGSYITHPLVQHMAVDIVGVIYEPAGGSGVEFEPLPGWHVNLRGDALPESLAPFVVEPQNPRRVWA